MTAEYSIGRKEVFEDRRDEETVIRMEVTPNDTLANIDGTVDEEVATTAETFPMEDVASDLCTLLNTVAKASDETHRRLLERLAQEADFPSLRAIQALLQ